MRIRHVLALLASTGLALALAACVAGSPSAPAPESSAGANTGADLSRSDTQGAVQFVVTPLNLAAPGETLDFDIAMNTHSVDVSWDLATQAALSTDSGMEVRPLSWPRGGGHHYSGILTFPAKTADGEPVLAGATKLTLTIRDTDVTERAFIWDLSN
jgi:hypothetical protein